VTRQTERYGSRGGDVEYVQELLLRLGYDVGATDGIYGTRTTAAVKEFQRKNHLSADGVVGSRTWAALERTTTTLAEDTTVQGDGPLVPASLAPSGGYCNDEGDFDGASDSTDPTAVVAWKLALLTGEHVVVHQVGSKLLGVGLAGYWWYTLYCHMSPCTQEEFEEQERQNYAYFHDFYPQLKGRIQAGERPPLFAAGCEADHNGTSWSGPYRAYQEDALADLYAHIAEWDHEIVDGNATVGTTPDCRFVAGCDGDHYGSSWCGPVRDTPEEATYDLNGHLAEWPSHYGTGASVRQV
jgi:hypothetical protein